MFAKPSSPPGAWRRKATKRASYADSLADAASPDTDGCLLATACFTGSIERARRTFGPLSSKSCGLTIRKRRKKPLPELLCSNSK